MYRRNLQVLYRPQKNNSVVLPESYLKLLNNYTNGCLSLIFNNTIHYMAWAPYGSTTCDTEIGINPSVAKLMGLSEGMTVKCSLIEECPVLDKVYVTAISQKDWEMLEVSSYRIQTTLLEQTRIVNNNQLLLVWINRAMSITIKVEELNPVLPFGKLENDTELIVSPFKSNRSSSNTSIPNGNKMINTKKSPLNENQPKKYNGIINSHDLETIVNPHDSLVKSKTVSNIPNLKSSQSTRNTKTMHNDDINYLNNRHSLMNSKNESPITSFTSTASSSSAYNNNINNNNNHIDNRKVEHYENLMKDLKSQNIKTFQFRCIPYRWINESLPSAGGVADDDENQDDDDCDKTVQMTDVYLTKHNLPELLDIEKIYLLKTFDNQEYCVNVRVIGNADANLEFPKNIYPTIELNDVLMKYLNIQKFERITLKPKTTVINFIEHIELFPCTNKGLIAVDPKEIEREFKKYILNTTKLYPMLINQRQIFRLNTGLYITIVIYPETFKSCLIDSEILRECKINCINELIPLDKIMKMDNLNGKGKGDDGHTNLSANSYVKLDKFQNIIDECIENNIINLCLDDRNNLRKLGNIIIIGAQNSGKTILCNKILENLKKLPYCCYNEIFYCAKNKGRKSDSIQRDLRAALEKCMNFAPSILVLDNLDVLTRNVNEQTQDAEYCNRVSDVIQQLILEYTLDNPIIVIATITNKSNLNRRIYSSRGKHLFQSIYKIPNLEKRDREQIIHELCKMCCKSATITANQLQINFNKFSNLTEGYTFGDLLQFIERSIFYAYRIDSKSPIITNDILIESLKTTNAYCLKGISNNNAVHTDSDNDDSDEGGGVSLKSTFAGLESALQVLEEVLMWPLKYPIIFNDSPLRNQAGILLFGPPGTGKTYLIGKILRKWNLRMISVKGPELLAKFIGQSEENVRNLFDRARSARPCVLFFDEFDSLAPRRGHDSTGVTDRVVNQLLTELDGVEGLQGVVVIAATSRPELLDPALLRSGRIDRLVECTLPNKMARQKIFENLSKSLHLSQSIDFQYFLDKTENYTGADLQSILTSANMIAVKECIAKDNQHIPDKIYITQEHLIEAFNNTRPSLSTQDISKYIQMYARFTNKEKPSRDFVAKRATLA